MVHWENLLPVQLSVWLHTLAHANIVSYINFGYNYGTNSIVLAYKLDQLLKLQIYQIILLIHLQLFLQLNLI